MAAAAPEIREPGQDTELVLALRAGDEQAFLHLVESLHGGLVRFARGFVSTEAAAEDVVQDTWVAVVQGIGKFEGRCALRSWVLSIAATVARTRAGREARSVPLSALQAEEPAVDPS